MVGIGIFFSLSFSPFVLFFFLPLLTHPSLDVHTYILAIRTKTLTYRNHVIDQKKFGRIFRIVWRRANVKLRVRSSSESIFTVLWKFPRDVLSISKMLVYQFHSSDSYLFRISNRLLVIRGIIVVASVIYTNQHALSAAFNGSVIIIRASQLSPKCIIVHNRTYCANRNNLVFTTENWWSHFNSEIIYYGEKRWICIFCFVKLWLTIIL